MMHTGYPVLISTPSKKEHIALYSVISFEIYWTECEMSHAHNIVVLITVSRVNVLKKKKSKSRKTCLRARRYLFINCACEVPSLSLSASLCCLGATESILNRLSGITGAIVYYNVSIVINNSKLHSSPHPPNSSSQVEPII